MKNNVFAIRYDAPDDSVRPQQDYQKEMALSLVRSVGLQGAIDCARQNQWEGVLRQIMHMSRQVPSA